MVEQMRSQLADIQDKTVQVLQKTMSNQKLASSSERLESTNREAPFSIRVMEKETQDKYKEKIPKIDLSQVTGNAPTPELKKEKYGKDQKKVAGGSMNNTMFNQSQSMINQTTEEAMKNKSLSLTLKEMMNQTDEYGTDLHPQNQSSMQGTQQILIETNNLFEPPETISQNSSSKR